ncbi:hypothetical protein FB567DRAFT_210364 [Paraphoma chrysanthemicola]|uniref:Uncharacterized protein n=1 Tax=Paraphoma chrysanthemicola TaxID=798071 RepID=A0A8K0QUX8_9PLEO|nr:hypothetical protein FB567DRAFT_210364 [Paraphoma chrysanthemicola]
MRRRSSCFATEQHAHFRLRPHPFARQQKPPKAHFAKRKKFADGVVDWQELHVDRSLLETATHKIIGGVSACMAQRRLIGGLIAGVKPVRAIASGLAKCGFWLACRWADGRGFWFIIPAGQGRLADGSRLCRRTEAADPQWPRNQTRLGMQIVTSCFWKMPWRHRGGCRRRHCSNQYFLADIGCHVLCVRGHATEAVRPALQRISRGQRRNSRRPRNGSTAQSKSITSSGQCYTIVHLRRMPP